MTEYKPKSEIDDERQSFRYYRNAVERHWDPGEIDLEVDKENIKELPDEGLDPLRRGLALFGAGEEAVTEDLAPLAVALEDISDQMFVTTQLYEESKHADFFHRYWKEVINPEEARRGMEESNPRDDEWFSDEYNQLFTENEEVMHRLLEDDTPKNRATAFCYYHMTIEGILGQTGYYGFQNNFGGEYEELPELPGLVEGFSKIRSDEGRHVGFGMWKLKQMVENGEVPGEFVTETVQNLAPRIQGVLTPPDDREPAELGMENEQLVSYALTKHTERMEQITNVSEDIPDVDELVNIEA